MASLDEFTSRIEQELSAGSRPTNHAATPAEYVLQRKSRRKRFHDLAGQLLSETIRPRVAKLAAHFQNASLAQSEGGLGCACWLACSEQCPANVQLELSLDHDEWIETLSLAFELHIAPAFMKYDPHDRLTMPIKGLDYVRLAGWVEDKLIGLLRTCHRLDRIDREHNDVLVTDPVCGMRLLRSSAANHMPFKGHSFFFCTAGCRQDFAAHPGRFASIDVAFTRWSLPEDAQRLAGIELRRAA